MDHEHWFDTLNKALLRATPRRAFLGAAPLVTSLALGGGPGADAAKKRKKNKKKGNGKGKGKNTKNKYKGKRRLRQCGPAVHNACETIFGTPEDIQFCKDKCERCREAGAPFCFHKPHEAHPFDHVTCCPAGEVCCQLTDEPLNECCPPDRCCEVNGRVQCLEPGETCCPSDPLGYCLSGLNAEVCCPETGCFRCQGVSVPNPETCDCECPQGYLDCGRFGCVFDSGETICCENDFHGFCTDGRTCCDEGCDNTDISPRNCGGCNQSCEGAWEKCCDGVCVHTQFDNAHCGNACLPCPAGEVCCHGFCIDPQLWECCPDHLQHSYYCPRNLTFCCTDSRGEDNCCFH